MSVNLRTAIGAFALIFLAVVGVAAAGGVLLDTAPPDTEPVTDDHWRLDSVERALADGLRTVPEVAARVAGDRPVRYLLPEAYGAAAHLASDGRATVTVEEGVRHYEPAG